MLEKIKLEFNAFKIQFALWKSENLISITDYILWICILFISFIAGGVWAGCAIAMTMTGPLVFFPIFGIQLCICILAILYYLYPEEIWEALDEGKEYCRGRFCKLQETINVHNHS